MYPIPLFGLLTCTKLLNGFQDCCELAPKMFTKISQIVCMVHFGGTKIVCDPQFNWLISRALMVKCVGYLVKCFSPKALRKLWFIKGVCMSIEVDTLQV